MVLSGTRTHVDGRYSKCWFLSWHTGLFTFLQQVLEERKQPPSETCGEPRRTRTFPSGACWTALFQLTTQRLLQPNEFSDKDLCVVLLAVTHRSLSENSLEKSSFVSFLDAWRGAAFPSKVDMEELAEGGALPPRESFRGVSRWPLPEEEGATECLPSRLPPREAANVVYCLGRLGELESDAALSLEEQQRLVRGMRKRVPFYAAQDVVNLLYGLVALSCGV